MRVRSRMWARLARWNRGIANAIGSLIVSKSGGRRRPEGWKLGTRRESLRRRGGPSRETGWVGGAGEEGE